MKWPFALVALLAACSPPSSPTDEEALSSQVDAEFRWNARGLFGDLLARSCGKRGFDRERLLAPERELIGAFEKRMTERALGQLQVARMDFLHEQSAGQRCEDNSDPGFAKIHMKSARRQIRAGLEQLETLAPRLEYSIPPEAGSAPSAAEIRYLVRKLVFHANFTPCDISTLAANDRIMAPALAEIAALKERLKPTPHAIHYGIGEADAVYEQGVTMVECADPRPDDPAQIRREMLARVRGEIAAIEARIRNG